MTRRRVERRTAETGEIRAAGYVRVSTEEQVDGTSLDNQAARVRAYCEAQGWQLAEVFVDGGASGKSLDRPALARLRAGASAGLFQRVVFMKLDRLSRKVRDLLAISDELERLGVGLVSIQEAVDTSTPSGRLFRTVLGAVAEFERDTIVERVTTGLRENAKLGLHTGGPVPFGYQRVGARFEPHPEEAPTVRRIFALRADGATFQAIVDALNADGLTTRRGGPWYPSIVQHIAKNPVYSGRIVWGKQQHERQDGVEAQSAIHTPIVGIGSPTV